MPSGLWLDARHCQFYLIGCHMFLYSYNSPWALFWDVVKLLGNSLIHLDLPFMSGALLSLGLIISHFGVLYPWILSLFGFLVLYLSWPVGTGTVPGTRHCSLQSSHMVLFLASGSFLTCVAISTLLNAQGGPSADFQNFLFVQLSVLWYSVSCPLFAVFFLNSELCLLNSRTLLSSAGVSPPYVVSYTLSKGIS